MMNHPDECNCEDCTRLYMVERQEIDMEEESKTIVPSSNTTLCASPRLPQVNHPHDCDCADCTFLYMLLPQETIDLEEDIIIVPSSPTSSTTTLYVSDSDSDHQFSYDEELQISNVDIFTKVQDVRDIVEDIVPGLHSPYSPIPSPYMFPESNHLALPNYMYGVDTPLSPPPSP